MVQPYTFITLCWVIFFVVWLISAFFAKSYVRRGTYGIGIRVLVIIAAFVLYQYPATRHFLMNGPFSTASPAVEWFGVFVCACGIAFAIWARFYLGRNWGTPMSLKKDAELVTSGPYRYVRHPIYSGMILAMLGTTLVIFWWIVPLICFSVYFVLAAKKEEGIMSREFPNTYPDYMKRSKMLIPFVL